MKGILPWQRAIWSEFQKRIQQRSVPHALLFHGPEGTGKNRFAMALARGLLCEQRLDSGEGCGSCGSCSLFEADTHPDLHLLRPEEGKQVLAVDQVREMVEAFSYTPQISSRKMVILAPAESMNRNAANSLLKTLEEPSGDAVMILVSHAPASLLPTIRSRCQQVAFPPPSREVALQWLQQQLKSREQAEQVLQLAEGAPLRALQLSESDQLDHFHGMGGELVALLQGEANPIQVAHRWSNKKLDPTTTLRWLQQWVVAIIKGGSGVGLPETISPLHQLLNGVEQKKLFLFHDKVNHALSLSTTPVNKELLFADLLLSWSSFR